MAQQNVNTIIVDDSKSIRVVLDAILNQLGVAGIAHCGTGLEALLMINSRPDYYQLLFVDLNMPEMDGMELIRHLGNQDFKGSIVIISGMEIRVINLASDIARQNKVHLIGNIVKPIRVEELEHILTKFHYFNDHLDTSQLPLSKAELEQAISEQRIVPYYQPKIDSNTNEVHSIEVLARIDNPGHGDSILPIRFIKCAEDNNLIDALTFQLLAKSIIDYKEMRESFGKSLALAFNLSPVQLNDLEMPKKLDSLFSQYDIGPSQIVIEVTEEWALQSPNQLETLNRLRMKGYGVSLDDFGTGFTNVTQLKSLPFSEIKIDRSFITDIHKDYFSQVIVNTLVDITQKYHCELVAEGIETHEEYEYLKSLKTRMLLQGYLISKPKPKNELIRWFHNWKKMSDEDAEAGVETGVVNNRTEY
ncbi:MAG: EAL domain-containing response regulator [Oleispira sp.]|nr:EAL domain-containing response regulator [Oleispira sp.]MBL4880593.1 EAL domain-containing response regulator [Oleispira sp.]